MCQSIRLHDLLQVQKLSNSNFAEWARAIVTQIEQSQGFLSFLGFYRWGPQVQLCLSEIINDVGVVGIQMLHKSIQVYNQYLSMQHQQGLNIFYQEKQPETLNENNNKEEPLPSVPYLQKGDSSKYLDQFIEKDEESEKVEEPQEPQQAEEQPQVKEELVSKKEKEQVASDFKDENYQVSEGSFKFNPSAFHNFQKHLTVCLKHSIEISPDEANPLEYQKVATKLWKAFKYQSISTKKVLHYLLGQRNEHKITEAGLKEYGLAKIYEQAGDRVTREARNFLASETLRQIKEGKLQEYINNKKLKDKTKFKKYVQIFVEELESGFLRKRLPKDKVQELRNC